MPSKDTNQLVVEEGVSGSGLTVAELLCGTVARNEDEVEPTELAGAGTSTEMPGRVLADLGGRPRRLGTVARATMLSAADLDGWALGRTHRRSPC